MLSLQWHGNEMPCVWAQQSPNELAFLLAHTAGARSILEVGSCVGMTLHMLAMFAAPGAKLRSIDLGALPDEAGPLTGIVTRPDLEMVARDLSDRGFDVAVRFDNSHNEGAIQWAKDNGPFDVVFIDGDHTYEGAKQDWEAYGPLGRFVAFHDIAHTDCGVPRLWAEIKEKRQTVERIVGTMGIGIVIG
jgi:predicted O-methyltransferase YrrM